MVVLNKMEDLPAMMTLTKLLASSSSPLTPSPPTSPKDSPLNMLRIHCLRLIELTQRTSAVMKVSERHFDRLDPVINVFRTFGRLNEVLVTAKLAIVPDNSFADTVQQQAQRTKAEMIIVPWTTNVIPGPSTIPQDEFIKQVLDRLDMHVSVLVDTNLYLDDESPMEPSLSRAISTVSLRNRALSMTSGSQDIEITPSLPVLPDGYHLFLPYFGGRDDQVALSFVIQLLRGSNVKATIVRIQCEDETSEVLSPASPMSPMSPISPLPPQVETPSTHLAPEPVQHEKRSPIINAPIINAVTKMVKFAGPADHTSQHEQSETFTDQTEDEHHVTSTLNALPVEIQSRLTVERVTTSTPLRFAVKRAKRNIDSNSMKNHLIIVGRAAKFPRDERTATLLKNDLRRAQSSEMIGRSCLGEVGEALYLGHVTGGILVVQSGKYEDE
jgi:hypothetical protein